MTLNLTPAELQGLTEQLLSALLPAMEKRSREQAKTIGKELHTLTVKEAAKRLKWSEKTVLGRIEKGELRAANVSTLDKPQYRISEAELNRFFQQCQYPR